MAKSTPAEFLASTEELSAEAFGPSGECNSLQERFSELEDEYQSLPPGLARKRLLLILRSLSRTIPQLHCPPYYPQ